MTEQSKRKLELIDEVYPAQRVQKSKERWESVWKGEKPEGRYPFAFGWTHFNPYNDYHTPQERLQKTLDGLIINGQFDDDLIPSVFPGLNNASIPSMFGAAEIRCGIETVCEKIILKNEDIDQLPEPKILPKSAAQHWLDAADYFMEETHGRIGVHICDMQGPFDSAAQLFGYDNLFLCAMEDPARYHRLLNLTTQAFILLWSEQEKRLGNAFVNCHFGAYDWIPRSAGATVSVDGLVMCSPNFYLEFVAPYITMIADALGGAVVHSCGDFRQVINELCATKGVNGINASQLSVRELFESGLDSTKTMIASTDIGNFDEDIEFVLRNNLRAVFSVWQ